MEELIPFAVKPKFRRPTLLSPSALIYTALLLLPQISTGRKGEIEGQRLPSCPEPSPQRVQVTCAEFGFHYKYRTIDGSCNNFGRPHWGSAGVPLLRLLPPQYDDVANQPLGSNTLPTPSEGMVIMAAHHKENDVRHTAMLAHFGQFIAHDLSLAKEAEVNCSVTPNDRSNCFNIRIPRGEQELRPGDVFPFRRSLSCVDGGLREQVNRLTAYVDASQIYGNNRLASLRIRERFPVDRGLLRENPLYRSPLGRGFLVFDESGEMVCHRNKSKADGMECFLSGDPRANEQLMLTAIHTVMLREHNRIARQLGRINPEWPGETVFQETRKLVAAIVQHVAYTEWLPKILGSVGMEMLGPYEGYDPSVNSGIANAISAAALRFGHAFVVPELARMDSRFRPDAANPVVRLREAFFAPESLIRNGGIEPLLRGSIASPVKGIEASAMVTDELTNHLFPSFHTFPLDLAALNIQRGRDHALPLYNEWRSLCGLERIQTWAAFGAEARDARAVRALADLYGQPQNLDLWVGGLMEKPLRGGKLGRTFSCLLADQFKRLRHGDRHWHENPGVFGLQQLASIRQYSLGKLLCHNMDDTIIMPHDAFVLYPGGASQFSPCESLPDLDLLLWRIDGDGAAGSFECSSPDCTCRYQVARPCAGVVSFSRDTRKSASRPSPRPSPRRRIFQKRQRVLAALRGDAQ